MIGIVAGLQLFQEFAIVVKTRFVAADHQFAERGDGEVRLAHSAGAHQQQTGFSASRVIPRESLYDELGLRQAAIPCCPFWPAIPNVGLKVFEVAVLVTARYARAGQAADGAVSLRTIAGNRPGEFGRSDRSSRGGVFPLDNALGLLIRVYPLYQAPASSVAQRTLRLGHDSRA